MKKIFIYYCFFLLSNFNLWAQEQNSDSAGNEPVASRLVPYVAEEDELYLKDDILLGANFGLNHGKNKFDNNGTTSEISTIEIWGSAEVGYFIADRLAVGLGVNLDAEYTRPEFGQELTSVDFYGGPFIRWYFVNKLHFQALGAYGIENLKIEEGSAVSNINYNGIYLSGGLGYDIFLNESSDVALQLGAGYVYKNLFNVSDNNNKITGGQFKYRIGLVFYFF